MKKLLLRYHQRLGDVIQCMSMAMQLAMQGHEVYVECNREYHSIFKLCPYVMPIYPGQQAPPGFKIDHVIDPQIWPYRYNEYRKSKMKWWDFVTSQHPLINGLQWSSPFQESLLPDCPIASPEKYCVIAATGFSQVPRLDPNKIIVLAQKLFPGLLAFPIGHQKGYYQATDLCELVSLIRGAGGIVTINTSIDYIADSVREEYDHVICEGFGGQDDFESSKQNRHKVEFIPIL